MTVADLTERELIARISGQLPAAPPWMLVGIGDDAAVVEPERNRVEVLTVDALVEGVHFDRAFVPPDAIGHRALAVNLSDIAAMGAAPRLALLSMALPPALPLDDFDRLVGGFVALANRHRLHVAGGNLTRSPGPLMINVTVTGTVKRRQALTRQGAKPGDEIYVSGSVGAAAAGLQMLRAGLAGQAGRAGGPGQAGGLAGLKSCATTATPGRPPELVARDFSPAGSGTVVAQDFSPACIDRYLRPESRVRLGMLLARNRAATACMDLSDGLVDAVQQLASASGVGAIIDADALPIDREACRWFDAQRLDPIEEAAIGGDDYELLATIRLRSSRRFVQAARAADVPVTRIGHCTEDPTVVLRRRRDGETVDTPLPQPAFKHFQ